MNFIIQRGFLPTRTLCGKANIAAVNRPLKQIYALRAALYHKNSHVYGHNPAKKTAPFQVSPSVVQSRAKNGNLYRLVTAYREHGHRQANLDPLRGLSEERFTSELDPSEYNLSQSSSTVYDLNGILNCQVPKATISDIVSILKNVYCGPVGVEFMYLPLEEREWFAERIELMRLEESLDKQVRKDIAMEMIKSQVFENFMGTKFVTLKRYGIEGAESVLAAFKHIFQKSCQYDVKNIVIGMAHRGRLYLLTGMLQYPAVNMFRKDAEEILKRDEELFIASTVTTTHEETPRNYMWIGTVYCIDSEDCTRRNETAERLLRVKGLCEFPKEAVTTGDVLSHLSSSVDLTYDGKKVHVTLIPNPSHLEAVNPVAVGKTRAKQMVSYYGPYSQDESALPGDNVLCVQVHGDAAISAQGINMETIQLANAPHFTVGGSIHLIINNQLGFTTPESRGRSSEYCTDLAKTIDAPVIHVNGDHPEEVAKAADLAIEYRQRFRKDVFLDVLCFRKWGHNELDDPTFTNPNMYKKINSRKSIADTYADSLIADGILLPEEVTEAIDTYTKSLGNSYNGIESHSPEPCRFLGKWKDIIQAPACITTWDTSFPQELQKFIGASSVQLPVDFEIHQHLKKTHIQNRLNKLQEGTNIDWATAEAIAIGSLLYQGFNVRLCGQDVGRGTFSHRHAMFVNQETEDIYIPLNHILLNQQGKLEVVNSTLSEEAVLGFEYGMSIEHPNNLNIWESQFGDFFNGAQIIIDTFITSGEAKWVLPNGLVMLLPHGYDGAGPEHSSCRIERFLQLCDSNESVVDADDVNMSIVHPTTPAQYFHLLRRQMVRNYRKPLVVVAPKVLLRLPAATSKLDDMAGGTTFLPVIGDDKVDHSIVQRVIICSGKHYYALDKQREILGTKETAIIRLEELCPFPTQKLQHELGKYKKATKFIWSQEEHQNMGPWTFVSPRFENLVGHKLTYVGRGPLATPAVGIGYIHQKDAQDVVTSPFQK